MNPEQLWDTTMNPENRTLVRVNIEDTADVEHLVTLLMGDKVGPRKEYISEYANFNKTDAFEEKAEKAQTTKDCRKGCNGCGLQRFKGVCKYCG